MRLVLKYFVLFFIVLLTTTVFCQQSLIDSLSKELSIEQGDDDRMQTLLKLANICRLSDIEQSRYYATKAVELAQLRADKSSLINAYAVLAEYHWKKTEYKLAFDFATKTKDLASQENEPLAKAEAMLVMGNIYTEIGDYANNSELFFQALEIYEKLENQKGIAHAYISIAAFYFEQDNNAKALEYATKSLELSKTLNDLNGTARALNNIGTIHGALEDYEQEELYYRESIEIAQKLEWELGLGVLYSNLGEVNFKMNRIERSFYYYDKAYEILEQVENVQFLAQLYILRAHNYHYNKEYAKAIQEAQKALDIGRANQLKKVVYQASAILHQLYKEDENTNEAYKYALLQSEMKDSLNLEEASTKHSLLELKYNYEKELQVLKVKQELKEYTYLIITIAITAILISIITALISRQKIRAKNNILATKQLELDIDRKNRELTSATMSLINTNEKLSVIENSIAEVKRQAENTSIKSALQEVLNKIELSSKSDVWKEFELRFNQVHKSFYDNLIAAYPRLTANDLRLCALLKLNLTTKEISELTGQRIPTIEIARSRLRKKLGITDRNENLVVFLSKF